MTIDFVWTLPKGGPSPGHYVIYLFDGTGREVPGSFWITRDDETTARRKQVGLCNTHFGAGADRAASWAVSSTVNDFLGSVPSDFGVATFDFQSCGAAGVPACQ